MKDDIIIKYYKEGHTIDFIAKVYQKKKNKDCKPVVLNGITLFPQLKVTLAESRLYVCEVIYNYLIKEDLAHTQTAS